MQPDSPENVTRLLRASGLESRTVLDALLPLVYRELHTMAGHRVGAGAASALGPTALVNEAYLKLARGTSTPWKDRAHFFRTAAVVMRSILVNHARDRRRLKRGGDRVRVPLDDHLAAFETSAVDLLALHEALGRLEQHSPRQATVVELRFFAGLSVRETAEALQVSTRTVEDDWSLARAWLYRELGKS